MDRLKGASIICFNYKFFHFIKGISLLKIYSKYSKCLIYIIIHLLIVWIYKNQKNEFQNIFYLVEQTDIRHFS